MLKWLNFGIRNSIGRTLSEAKLTKIFTFIDLFGNFSFLGVVGLIASSWPLCVVFHVCRGQKHRDGASIWDI